MGIFGWGFLACFAWAVLMDLHDSRRGRRRRPVREMLTIRGDARADSWATQHQGIPVPVDRVIKDRLSTR